MNEVTLDIKLARAVAQILNARWTGTPKADAVCHAFSDILVSATVDRTDADIALKRKIAAALEPSLLGANTLVDVDVHDGIVALRGIVPCERERHEIYRIASQVDGVMAVHDHLIEVDIGPGAFLLSADDSAADFNHPAVRHHAVR
jgi:osmotically-inducible protein OsmY